MSYHARTILTPGASRKRKERESFYASATAQAAATSTKPTTAKESAVELVTPDNRLLAGYMAHEFLTRGTVLGARPEAARDEPPKQQPEGKPSGSYGEVSSILKAEGVHVAGILNPSQLARWIQM